MRKITIFMVLAVAFIFSACQSNSASLKGRSLTEDEALRDVERRHADPMSRAIRVKDGEEVWWEGYSLDHYPIIGYWLNDTTFDVVLAVVIDHGGTYCHDGLARVDNTRVSMYSAIDLEEKTASGKPALGKAPKIIGLGTGRMQKNKNSTPRKPNPPFRVKNGYTVCEIVPEGQGSLGARIYDQTGEIY